MTLPTREELDRSVVDAIVRRIVEVADPEKIILFGSAAKGQMGPHSDVDLLVVKGGEYHRRKMAVEIRRALRGIEEPFDIVVATPEDLEQYGDSPSVVYYPALREGAVIYDR